MRNRLLLIGLLASTAACGPRDLPREEIKGVIFPDKGVFAGYDFGDSWSDIKAKHPDYFEVRDDDFKQLRRDVGDNAGSNGYYIGFSLDKAGKVVGLEASIHGKKQNSVMVRELLDEVIAHYEKTVGKGECRRTGKEDNSTSCSWVLPGKPRVDVTYNDMPDLHSGALNIAVKPAS